MKVYLSDGALDMSEVIAIVKEKKQIKVLFKNGGHVYFDDAGSFDTLRYLMEEFERYDD